MIKPNDNSLAAIVKAGGKVSKSIGKFFVDGEWNEDEYATLEMEVVEIPKTISNIKKGDVVICHRFVALHQALIENNNDILFYAEPSQIFAKKLPNGELEALNGISICKPIIIAESKFDLAPKPQKDKATCVNSKVANQGDTIIYQISADKPFTIDGEDYLFVDDRFVFATVTKGEEIKPREGLLFIEPRTEGLSSKLFSKTKTSNIGTVIKSSNPEFAEGSEILYKPKGYNKIQFNDCEYLVTQQDQIYGTIL